MSQTKVEAPFVEGGGGSNFKNLMVNGDMKIAQRATSVSSHSADTYVNIDRWKTRVNNQGVFTVSQSTTVPTGEGFVSSQKWDCTTADASPASTDYIIYQQPIEAQNLQHLAYGTSSAKKLTLSFHVRSNKTGAYTVGLYSEDGTRHIVSSYTISSADTWEKKIVTFAGDTGGTINNDNGEGLRLWFWLGAGTNFSSGTHATSWAAYDATNVLVDNQVNLADSTDNEWYITGIQLEVGDDASDFEHLPTDVQLDRCMRYTYVHNNDADSDQALIFPGATRGGTNKFFYIQHPRPMRDTPSVTVSGEIRIINCTAGDSADADDTLTIGGVTPSIAGQNANEKGVTIAYTGAVTGITDTANTGYMMMFIKETNNKLTFDAEL